MFKGIAEFAAYPPEIITGDNYEERAQALGDLLSPVTINIFNIAKIASEVRGGRHRASSGSLNTSAKATLTTWPACPIWCC